MNFYQFSTYWQQIADRAAGPRIAPQYRYQAENTVTKQFLAIRC